MPKVRVIVAIDEEVVRALRARAAGSGSGVDQFVEEALRRDLGLDLIERLGPRTAFRRRPRSGWRSRLSTGPGYRRPDRFLLCSAWWTFPAQDTTIVTGADQPEVAPET
jgi:hypothetical protein